MNYNFDHFVSEAEKFDVILNIRQLEQFETYYEMLMKKNQVMNLTAITEFDEVVEKHFLDSIALAQVVQLNRELRVMDMGTGAGFPGVPLKIVFPQLSITMSDSLNKRILFLQEVIDVLELKGIEAIHGRAEDLAKKKEYREGYDLAVSRAVANLSTLSEYCLPFVKVGGKFISYKSKECDLEVETAGPAISILGGELSDVKKFCLGELQRAFVIIDKTKSTAKKYPRKAGTPSREPL